MATTTIRRRLISMAKPLAVIAVLAAGAGGPAWAQTNLPDFEGFETFTRESRIDRAQIEKDLQEIVKDLEEIEGQLRQGDQIVQGFKIVSDTYSQFRQNWINKTATCLDLALDAKSAQERRLPTWPRFAKRAETCQQEIRQWDATVKGYEQDFERVKHGLSQVKESLELLERSRDERLAEQQFKQSLQDLEGAVGQTFQNFDGFNKSVLGY